MDSDLEEATRLLDEASSAFAGYSTEEGVKRLRARIEKFLARVRGEDVEVGDGMTDAEADADTLRSAGWGTDEDYGGGDERL
jgi:hypothetical protein